MSRKTFDESREPAPLPPHGAAPIGRVPADRELLPCHVCGTPTERATLSNLGARCRACYETYCRQPNFGRPLPAGAVIPRGLHAWAYRLRARLDAGEKLHVSQQQCLDEFEWRHGPARWGDRPLPDGSAPTLPQRRPDRERIRDYALELGIDVDDACEA